MSVASSNSERIIETPAIVSQYNMQGMSGLGLRTLKGLLSFISGLYYKTAVQEVPAL